MFTDHFDRHVHIYSKELSSAHTVFSKRFVRAFLVRFWSRAGTDHFDNEWCGNAGRFIQFFESFFNGPSRNTDLLLDLPYEGSIGRRHNPESNQTTQ